MAIDELGLALGHMGAATLLRSIGEEAGSSSDLGVGHLRFLAALGGQQPDGLFFAGAFVAFLRYDVR